MFKKFLHSFPIQLLLLNLKKNQALLLLWILLVLVVSGKFGSVLGIPYLFLDPEYLNNVSFGSFFIVGATLGGFTMAFHISCYILDGYRFPFLGTISKPFTKFSLNNSIIPLAFFILYIVQVYKYQSTYEYNTHKDILYKLLGLTIGNFGSQLLLYIYFWVTNKDIFVILAENVEKRIRKIKITRVSAIKRIKDFKNDTTKVTSYLDLSLKPRKANFRSNYIFPDAISKVFDQNHLNSVIAELFIFVIIIMLGAFRDNPYFQIPAASSGLLFLTIILMLTGAISYWFRGWSFSFTIAAILIFNYTITSDLLVKKHYAHGLNYETEPKRYHLSEIKKINSPANAKADSIATIEILENWRKRTLKEKPRMFIFCSSGGGQRSSLWTMHVMQQMDRLSDGQAFRQIPLITGASGGLIGAAFYRELKLRALQGEPIDPLQPEYLKKIGDDMLNPIIFSLLVNDVFFRYQSFTYNGFQYPKDRGYSFEQQLNHNTDGLLNKPLIAYLEPERQALIPLLLLSPTSINDGRKLYISPQNVSYLSRDYEKNDPLSPYIKLKGIDFMRFFKDQDAQNLSFLTALRMSATFPYVTPNVAMPSEPAMKLMDAGLSDNFGVADAVRFTYAFRHWIAANTSGVVFVSARDSFKENKIERELNPTLFQKIFTPISNVYNNWTYIQDIRNDILVEYARTWFDGNLEMINFEYGSSNYVDKTAGSEEEYLRNLAIERASLSWRLTGKEKIGIINAINTQDNSKAMQRFLELLEQ